MGTVALLRVRTARVWPWATVYVASLFFVASHTFDMLSSQIPASLDASRVAQVRAALLLGAALAPLRALTGGLAAAFLIGAVLRTLGTRIEWLVPFRAAVTGELLSTIVAAVVSAFGRSSGDWVSALLSPTAPTQLSGAASAAMAVVAGALAPTTLAYALGVWQALRRNTAVHHLTVLLTVLTLIVARIGVTVMLSRAVTG